MSFIDDTSQLKGGTGPETDGEDPIFLRLKKMVLDGHAARSKWRAEAARAFKYVASDQWSQEDTQLLKDQNRPSVTFNRTAPIIKAVCGLEVNNRRSAVYLARTVGDAGLDESRTDCAKWVRDVCDAEDEESEAFRDLVICGEGWIETRMDYEDDVKGRVIEERIDPLEMGTNDSAGRSNYKDARLIYRIRELDSRDAAAMFEEDFNSEALHARWIETDTVPSDGGLGDKKDYPSETRAELERSSGKRTKVRLVQVQWWDKEPFYLVAQEGVEELQELSEEDFKRFQERATAMQQADAAALDEHNLALGAHMSAGLDVAGMPPPAPPAPTAPNFESARVMKRCYYEAFLGSGLLQKKKLEMGTFQFKAMTGERDRDKKCFYGMVRDMFDPQMWANKWLSQTMHIMNTNAKGGIMAETDAFLNVKQAERDWADNTKIIWVKSGSLIKKKIQERTPPPLPQGLGELMQFALGSLRDVTGVNLELLGQADREQAASLEAQRRRSAMTILATMFDSKRKFNKEQGRLLLHFIELLPEGTLYRVLDQGQYKYVPLIKKGDINEYDVVIDEAPSSPDQRQEVWALTTTLLGQGLPLPMPVIVKLLKYSPYPESVVKEISDAMGLGSEMPPEMLKQKLEQAEQALQVLEGQLKEATEAAKTERDQLKIDALEASVKVYKAETERLAAQWTARLSTVTALTDAANTPDASEGGQPAPAAPAGDPGLTEKVNQIQAMLAQLLQGMQPAQPPVALDPNAVPAEGTM